MASIEIATPDSACEPGHSRRPSHEAIRVHRSGLPRMTSRPRALHRTRHTGRPQPAARGDLGRRRKRFRLRDAQQIAGFGESADPRVPTSQRAVTVDLACSGANRN